MRRYRRRWRLRRLNKSAVAILFGLVLFFISLFFWQSSGEDPAPLQDAAMPDPKEPFPFPSIALDAQAAVLMDVASGRVFYSKNGDKVCAPASLTKLMTALLAVEQAQLDAQVTASRKAAQTSGAQAGVVTGQTYRLEDLLWAMLFLSGNDAAVVIAEHLGGSVAAFAELMNARAAELGAEHTNFINPNGLTTEGHLSTAYDLALIARAVLQNSKLREILGSKEAQITWEGCSRTLRNINRFLQLYPGATGLKTGYTDHAGFCLAASAEREGRHLVAIILGASTSDARWGDAMRLLDQGFANYEYMLTGVGEPVAVQDYHTVSQGQTLSEIASLYHTTVAVLQEANNLGTRTRLDVGQILVIP